jgi:hypothetical protein
MNNTYYIKIYYTQNNIFFTLIISKIISNDITHKRFNLTNKKPVNEPTKHRLSRLAYQSNFCNNINCNCTIHKNIEESNKWQEEYKNNTKFNLDSIKKLQDNPDFDDQIDYDATKVSYEAYGPFYTTYTRKNILYTGKRMKILVPIPASYTFCFESVYSGIKNTKSSFIYLGASLDQEYNSSNTIYKLDACDECIERIYKSEHITKLFNCETNEEAQIIFDNFNLHSSSYCIGHLLGYK